MKDGEGLETKSVKSDRVETGGFSIPVHHPKSRLRVCSMSGTSHDSRSLPRHRIDRRRGLEENNGKGPKYLLKDRAIVIAKKILEAMAIMH